MGKRGPAPVSLEELLSWERQWWHSFRALRDGHLFSVRFHVEPKRQRDLARLRALRQMTAEEFHQDRLIDRTNPNDLLAGLHAERVGPPLIRETAEEDRLEEIRWLQKRLKNYRPRLTTRRDIWRALIAARTEKELERVCRRWARLRDVQEEQRSQRRRMRLARLWARKEGATFSPDKHRPCSPEQVVLHAAEFLSIKNDPRFPRSDRRDAENSRVDYLARGMAGIFASRSPATGIELLRNMKHDERGPKWDKKLQECSCWRCMMRTWPGGTP